MFTRPKALVSARVFCTLSLILSAQIFAAEYPRFNLQVGPRAEVPSIAFSSARLSMKGKSVEIKGPSLDATTFFSAKEAFVTEKRDEAIKILRQQLDAGLTNNRDNQLLKLGQLYAEKYMEMSYRENEIFTAQLNEKAKRRDEKEARLDNSRSQRYLKDALHVFNTMEKEFPNHPKIDEVDFFIGFVELEQGKEKRGVQYLERVVQRYPQSRKFDEALVYLGDFYFEKHKLNEAVVRFKALASKRSSALFHYAKYKLAWCEMNQGRARAGLNTLKGLVSELSETQEPAKFNLRNQTLKDMVVFFAEVEAVDEAINFYQTNIGREAAAENIKLIADMLRSKARDESAVRAYVKVLEFYPDTLEALKAESAIFEASIRLGKIEKAVSRFVQATDRYSPSGEWASKFGEKKEELTEAIGDMQAQAEKAALFFHQSAQKSSNKNSYKYALMLYDAILKDFPDHASFKKIAFYRAEILFNQARWIDAAEGYMRAAQIAPKDKLSDEAVYDALLCLDRMTAKADSIERYTKEQQQNIDTTVEEIPPHEQRFIEIADYYVKEYPQGERVVDVRFRTGAIYYRHKHFDQALDVFKYVATHYPNHRTATTSAHLVLDIYNIKKDYAKLTSTATEFALIKNLGDVDFREAIGEILGQIAFKDIEHYEKQNLWNEAAESYLEFYKKNSKSNLAGDALYNALVCYEKLNDIDKVSEMARLYLSRFPGNEHSKRVMLVSAKLAERTYDIEQAAKLYEDFATRFPKDSDGVKALFNAAVFNELLERNKEALELYSRYLKTGGPTAEETKSIAISQAKLYRRQGHWEKVSQIYRRLSKEAKSAEERVAILGELVRQYEKGGNVREREGLLKEMLELYENNRRMRTGPGFQYVAEAKFKALQKAREKFQAVKLRFPPEDLIYGLKKKQRLLTQMVKDYDRVVEMGVPEWGVAALFEKSAGYTEFVSAYRAVKVPGKYKDQERVEAEKALSDIDAQLVKPLESKSGDIIKACADRAAQFHVISEYATKCSQLAQGGGGGGRPVGLVPHPNYWSTRWPGEEGVARR
ncbi:MAG: tetratricopeptide repeat protein [Deltaproteobacteria bacterium]|nr:tetratricopeptide repeat protein [Deltaproteobacteria bacterium]MBI3296167.1 tetratricopeptide repeat protein [Deltaproteobacteria bacterium]